MSEFSIRTQPFRLSFGDHIRLRLRTVSLTLTRFPAVLAVAWLYIGLPLQLGLPGLLRGAPGGYILAQTAMLGLLVLIFLSDLPGLWRNYRRESMMHGERLMILDTGAVRLTGPGFDVRQAWSAINRVGQSRDHIFLHMPSGRAHMIPKSALASPHDADRLYALACLAVRAAPAPLPPLPEAPDSRELWLSPSSVSNGNGLCFNSDHVRFRSPTLYSRS